MAPRRVYVGEYHRYRLCKWALVLVSVGLAGSLVLNIVLIIASSGCG